MHGLHALVRGPIFGVGGETRKAVAGATRAGRACCACVVGLASLGLVGCNTNVRPGATSILQAFAQPTPAEAANLALDEFDPNNRFRGTQLLAGASFAGEDVYMRLFRERLADEDPGVRAVAVRAVGTHGRPEDVASVLPMLTDADVDVRVEAARALQRLHNPEAVPALLDALRVEKQPEPRVRQEAADALGQYRQARVVEALIAALDDDNLGVNTRALASLRTLTGQDFGLSRARWTRFARGAASSENAGSMDALFAAGAGYTYPVFQRGRRWYEYIPLVPQPPNETPALPAGVSPADIVGGAGAAPVGRE